MHRQPFKRAIRGRFLWFTGDPVTEGARAYRYLDDGMMLIRNGMIVALGEAFAVERQLPPGTEIVSTGGHLVMPGFIDPHIHFPQTQVIASYGATLLDWLERYTFVEEQRFANPAHAARVARFFLDTLLANGTTTALAFCSVHPASVDAFLSEAESRGAAMIGGKVMMDRNCPHALRDTPLQGYDETKALIEHWHGHGRQQVAIAPRFAITSSPAQLDAAGTLAREYPGCLIETHLSESLGEIETVRGLFPEAQDYTDVYDRHGLLTGRTLLGHCVHLSPRERARITETGAVAVHCPTSNLFLGSGLFDAAAARAAGMRLGLATDVGAGTSYSLLATLGEAYKVRLLRGDTLTALEGFHQITRGNALALGLSDQIGCFSIGRAADFVVLDARATPAMAHRMERAQSLEDELFTLMTMGDDRAVAATYLMGAQALPAKAPAG